MKYAVLTQNGDLIDKDLIAQEAARTILTHDGKDYEIRPADGLGFILWYRQQVANIGWRKTAVYSVEDDADKAETEIFAKVIASDWRGEPYAMTMADYDQMQKEA